MVLVRSIFLFISVAIGVAKAQTISYAYHNNGALLKYDLIIDQNQNIAVWNRTMDARGENTKGQPIDFVKKNNQFYFIDKTKLKKYAVQDQSQLKWHLTDEKIQFLGYECHIAKVEFRGRYYTVYYAPSLKIPYGPWKFSGLDGLILFAKSEDGNYIFSAESIDLNPTSQLSSQAETFINQQTFISWDTFQKYYKEDINLFLTEQKCNCESDGKNIIKISKIEKIDARLHDIGIVY